MKTFLMKWQCKTVCLSLFIYPVLAYSQGDGVKLLRENGFEEIQLHETEDNLYVSLEDNVYRVSYEGIAAAIQKLHTLYPTDTIHLLLTNAGMVQLSINAFQNKGEWHIATEYDDKRTRTMLEKEPIVASANWKADVVLYPQISLDNHRLDRLYNAALNIAPAMHMTLWRGASLTAQIVVPIWNNIGGTSDHVRPGWLTLQQTWLEGALWHCQSTFGLFNRQRWGIHNLLQRHLSKRCDLSLHIGSTGFWEADGMRPIIERWKRFDISLHTEYYIPTIGLQIEISGGHYTFGDYGGRIDLTRHFGETSVGVYARMSEDAHDGGFHFAIPMGNKHLTKHRRIRVRVTDYFDWEYRMVSDGKWIDKQYGIGYETSPRENRSADYMQAAYIEIQLNKVLNKESKKTP